MLARAYSMPSRTAWLIGAILTAIWLVIYLITVSPTVNFIDSGELITALHEPGVVHPPGYPLYTLLGYVASHVPIGEIAWRVNLFSAFWGAMAVGTAYVFLVTLSSYTGWLASRRAAPAPTNPRRKASKSAQAPTIQAVAEPATYSITIVLAAIAGACLLGAASTFWNRSVQAKMYTLHYFFVMLLFWLATSYRWAYERGDARSSRRLLIALAAGLGLSFTNHLMTSLLLPGLAVLLVVGNGWREWFLARFRELWERLPAPIVLLLLLPLLLYAMFRHLLVALPALLVPLLVPLLLYVYLPVRASEGPIMDWGSPDTLPDFWRHISGWQYQSYLTNDLRESAQRLWTYATGQWVWLTVPVLLLSLASAIFLARANLPVFVATLTTAVVTVAFALRYGISEIEPYLVPMYMMLIIWLGSAPPLIDRLIAEWGGSRRVPNSAEVYKCGLPTAALFVALALVSAGLQFPRQNHSNDHLAELFALNIFNNLEKNSIIITDHWDFQSPSYYMQLVRDIRPDITVVDKSLLRYPWYLGQLERRYPWLIANSRDIADTFRLEQRKWVNGEAFDQSLLQNSYIQLMTSFVERNISTHPAYVFFSSQCDPSLRQQNEEGNLIAQNYTRQVSGIAYRLWPQPPPANLLPPEPKFDLRGYTNDKTPLDDFAKVNAGCYATAYTLTAQAYAGAKNTAKAQELAGMAAQIRQVIGRRE